MIAKGNTHDNGARLARYITSGKGGELAHLWELRGFASRDITEAFRSVHIMARKGQCQQPFFHVQVRNPPGEHLTRDQWFTAINKIESAMRLTDQPRAIAVHIDHQTGHEHIHVAWSRIHPDTLRAKALPFFKLRLKRVSRELESELGLTPVSSKRGSSIRYAARRHEEQQAIRLGVPINDVRELIKGSFEKSDCGRSFQSALDAHGLLLAKGERRDFLVVDSAGGMHALGKRILGVSAAEIRDRLADLCRDLLPTLEQAREFIAAAKQVSLDNRIPDVNDDARAAPMPVGERRRTRHVTAQKEDRAAGKEQLADQVRKQLAITQSAVPIDHLVTGRLAPGSSLESETASIDQLRNQTPEPAGDAAQNPEVLRAINSPQERTGGQFSCDETAGLEPVTAALPQHGQTPPFHKTPGSAARLRDQFRAIVKQLTAKVLQPRPTSRKRRREEIGGGFRRAALGLLRSIARVPPLHFLDAAWEPFTWLRIWEYNCPASTDIHHDCSVSPPPEDISLRL